MKKRKEMASLGTISKKFRSEFKFSCEAGHLHHWTFINVESETLNLSRMHISISEKCGLHCLTWPTWNAFLANHSFTIHHGGKKRLFCRDKTHQWGYLTSWRPNKIEEDKNEIRDYVKEVLFEKVVFIWNKGALQPGVVLHKGYLTNCRAKIAGSKLMNAMDSEAEMYMHLLWTIMVKENCYREWLSHKRSAKYQAVEDMFASESTRWMMIVACLIQICSIVIA
jgi:hypothetical protein